MVQEKAQEQIEVGEVVAQLVVKDKEVTGGKYGITTRKENQWEALPESCA